MRVLLVSYDLRVPGDYEDLFKAIKSLSNGWWHCLQSVWMIKSDSTCATIRDHLQQHLRAGDKLLVVQVGNDWGTAGLDAECNNWLRSNIAA